jgi:hypothetical protein
MSDSTEFLFPGPIWFIAPKQPCLSIDELCRVVLKGVFEDKVGGVMRPMVFAFSDRDLAARFLEKSGEQAAPYAPLALPQHSLIEFLTELPSHGYEFLGTDAESTTYWLHPIAGVVEQLRRRQSGADPGEG